MSTMQKSDDQTGGESGGPNSSAGSAPVSPPSPALDWRRRKWLLVGLIAASMGLLTAQRARWLNKQRTQQYNEARRYSAAADTAQKTENLEQLFAASGARVKVLSFTDTDSGVGEDWTSRYEAEVEFLNDCQLQESLAARWSPETRLFSYLEGGGFYGHVVVKQGVVVPFDGPTRGPWRLEGKPAITQFQQGERRIIKGLLAIDGFSTTTSVGPDGSYGYTRRLREENGEMVGSKAWWFAQNRIPTGPKQYEQKKPLREE